LASADYKVIDNLIIPEYADYNIRFALNEMAIAYTDRSKFSNEIAANNWYEILSRKNVSFGRSDPDVDPCGYRTLMVFQLAQKHYNVPGLSERLTKKDNDKYIRPKETDLLALLEAGEIDYLFIYRSVAAQHGLQILLLPDEINLKDPALTEFYNTATVKVSGKKPGEFIVRKGEPMVYSVTILKNAQNAQLAQEWIELLLSPAGRNIFEKNGQPFMKPFRADGFEKLPEKLKRLCPQND